MQGLYGGWPLDTRYYPSEHEDQGWYEDFEPKSDIKIGRLFLAFFGVFLAFLRYYTIVYLSNSSVLSNNFFKINNFKDFLKELLVFF